MAALPTLIASAAGWARGKFPAKTVRKEVFFTMATYNNFPALQVVNSVHGGTCENRGDNS